MILTLLLCEHGFKWKLWAHLKGDTHENMSIHTCERTCKYEHININANTNSDININLNVIRIFEYNLMY